MSALGLSLNSGGRFSRNEFTPSLASLGGRAHKRRANTVSGHRMSAPSMRHNIGKVIQKPGAHLRHVGAIARARSALLRHHFIYQAALQGFIGKTPRRHNTIAGLLKCPQRANQLEHASGTIPRRAKQFQKRIFRGNTHPSATAWSLQCRQRRRYASITGLIELNAQCQQRTARAQTSLFQSIEPSSFTA